MWGVPYFPAPMAPINLIPSFSSRLNHCFPPTHTLPFSFSTPPIFCPVQPRQSIPILCHHICCCFTRFPNWPIMLCPLAVLLTKTLAVTGQLYYRGDEKEKKVVGNVQNRRKILTQENRGKGAEFSSEHPEFCKAGSGPIFHLCKKRVCGHKKSATFTTSPHPTQFPSWYDRQMSHASEMDTMVTKRKRQKMGNTFQHLVVTNNAASKSVISLRVQNKRLVCVDYNQSQWLTQTTEKVLSCHFDGCLSLYLMG